MLFRILKTVFLFLLLFDAPLFPDDGPEHQVKQTPPIKLGTSGGNINDETTKFCCGGTLGALVKDAAGNKFILSNNHVLARSNKGVFGEAIIQPGLIDVNCGPRHADVVAHLSRWARINFDGPNTIDAALAKVVPGMVRSRGKIIDIGRPGRLREPAIGMGVKKSGRTTGKTYGEITAINMTVLVEMPRYCGDKKGKKAKFVDQFFVSSTTSRHFIDAGDSGSLILKRKHRCPRSVGLVFAGDDDGNAVANRLSYVLSSFGVSIVGCSTTAASDEVTSVELTRLNSEVMRAQAVRQRYEDQLFQIQGVQGVGIGAATPGSPTTAIVVFMQKQNSITASTTTIPRSIDQIPVRVILTSGFKAL